MASGPILTPAPWGSFGITWEDLNQWDHHLVDAAAEFGDTSVPHIPDLHPTVLGNVMKAMMAIESGGRMFDGNGNVIIREDGLGFGISVGLMQVKPAIWGPLASQIGANIFEPRGNIRVGSAIMADAIDQYGSWEAAITRVYFPSDDPNGTTQNEYVVAVRGLLREMGGFEASSGSEFSPFTGPRVFHVRPDARASARNGPSRSAPWIRDFDPGEAVTCDGVLLGEAVQGERRWLRTTDPEPLVIHASAFIEAIGQAGSGPAVVADGHMGHSGSHQDRLMVATTVDTKLRDAPRGNVVRQLAAGTRLRVTGDPDHGFLPVTIPSRSVRGWVKRDHVVRVGTPDSGHAGENGDVHPATDGIGRSIAQRAQSFIGRPFQMATHGPDTFDCSGLVHWVVLQATGTSISPDSHAQFNLGVPVVRNRLQPGDLLFYDTQNGQEVREGNTASHVGIFFDSGEMVNALNEETGVVMSDPFSSYFAARFIGAKRLF